MEKSEWTSFWQFFIRRKKGILLCLIVSILCLTFFESLIRFKVIPFPSYINSDEWWEERWLRNRHIISEITYYPIDKYHPILGWTLKENLNKVNVYNGSVSSNSAGIRGKKEYSIEKTNKTRILTIGDSFTFGEGINDNKTFSTYLEKMYENSEVINMGVHGYGTDQQLLKLKISGLKYNPDIVILGFYYNDIYRNELSFRDFVKPKFILKNGNLTLTNVPVISPKEYEKAFRLRTFNYLKILKDKFFGQKINEEKNFNLSYRLLEEIIKESQSANATPIFVYLPRKKEVIKNKSPGKLFLEVCNKEKVTCINPIPKIRNFLKNESNPESYFEYHYGEEIHKLIAEEIYENLMSKELFN